MSIDWDKVDWYKLPTRDGREVRIYTTKGQNKIYPVVGEYYLDPTWRLGKWTIDGEYVAGETDNNDLVNVPQQHTVSVQVYRRPDGTVTLNGCEDNVKLIVCFEHTFTEGEGLE